MLYNCRVVYADIVVDSTEATSLFQGGDLTIEESIFDINTV